MKMVTLPDGEQVAALGQGTWFMGDKPANRNDEIAALRAGIDLGMTVIDTAEMYGSGRSERLVGEALQGRRDQVFLVSKVLPNNAGFKDCLAACERSLQRLQTDRLDLYLLHWRGGVPFSETIEAFETLQRDGKIRRWGVSNLDIDDMDELVATPGGEQVSTNQLLYNLSRRGIEWDLLPWCQKRGLPVMAYSPVEQARLLNDSGLVSLANELGLSVAQLALAWILRQQNVIAIPKAGHTAHVQENARAAQINLSPETLSRLDRLFPPPVGPRPLDIL
ncbi:aldo/keto reductase [uncultured Martelella sp.]|uniref:aldo/keto reductase n=1 Tax=uncultured Martelella sp. TaxID=392331 RepID=UPI0029C7553D|nr:aldo/keto reductase [uncultured Martelella sp.]